MHRTVCHQLPSKMNKLSLKNTNTYCVHCTARELLKNFLKQLFSTLHLAMHTAQLFWKKCVFQFHPIRVIWHIETRANEPASAGG